MVHSTSDAPIGFTLAVQVVLWFTVAHLVFAAVFALMRGTYEFLAYLAFTPVIIFIIARLHLRIRLSLGLLWCISLLALLHMLGGLMPIPADWPHEGKLRLYDWWIITPDRLKYDQLVHGFGTSLATWFCWQALQRTVASKSGWGFHDLRPTPELLAFCILAGMGIGSINEISEFVTTIYISDNGVGGYQNTLMDLVYNTIGSVVVALIIWWHGRQTCAPGGVACEVKADK